VKKLLLFLAVTFGVLLLGNKALAANGIVYSATYTSTYGTAVDIIPTVTGGAATNATLITGTIPGGLTLNAGGTITGNPTAAGTYAGISVRVRIGGTNYTSGTFTITISKAALTITASTNNKPYGNTLTNGNITTGFTYTGIQNGETVGRVTAAYGTGAASTAAIGTYTNQITISGAAGGTFTASNYTITYAQGNIVVGTGALTITANVSKVYGTTLTGGTGFTGFTATGLATGETIGSVTVAYGTGSAATDPAGTDANQVTVSAATGGTFNPANYTITYNTGTITVTKAPLTITANNQTKAYGTTFTFAGTEFTTSGLLNSDAVTSCTLTSAGSAAGATVAGGPYAITPSAAVGSGLTNYTITYATTGTMTVTTVPLTITATGPLKPYGTTINAGASTTNFTASGAVIGTVTSVTLTPDANGASPTTPVGSSYVITPSAPTGTGGFAASNYSITYVPYDGTVTAGNLNITANVSKVYGNLLTGGTGFTGFTATGLATGETIGSVTVAYGTGSAATDAVGAYAGQITVSAATGGTFNPANYNITYTTGTITVTKAPLTITATGPAKTYGTLLTTQTYTTNFTATGLQNGETVTSVTLTMTGAGRQAAGAAGSAYVATPSAAAGSFTAGNYTITYVPYDGTVAQAPLTITGSTNNKPYGTTLTGGNITTGFTYTGIQNGETVGRVTAAYGTGSASTAAIGTYTNQITISGAAGGTFTASNYIITYVQGNIVVGQGALTITATGVSRVYGTAITSPGAGSTAFTATGLATGETVGSVTITYLADNLATTPVGAYAAEAQPSLATGGTFNPANYNITYTSGTLTVTKAPLTITATNVTKNYGATLTSGAGSTAFTPTGLQNGETVGSVTITYGTGSAATAAVGVYNNQVTPSAATGGTFTASNYTITYVSGSITVITSPPALTYASNTYAVSTTFTLTPTNGGSAATGASISPALPAGITISATGVVSGSYATAGTLGPFTVTATNSASPTGTTSNSFTITFVSPPTISYPPGTFALTAGTSTTISPTLGGGAVASFAFGTGTALTGATLSTPYGIGINPANGDIYVTNSGNATISYFTSAGTYVGRFSTGFNTPVGIVFDSSGNAYIADAGSNDIYKVTAGGVKSTLINGVYALTGIAIDASNNLYLSTGGFFGFVNQVYKYSSGGTLLSTLSDTNTADPAGVAVDGSGNIYVVDNTNNNVVEYNSSGVYVSTFATGFNGPEAIAIDKSGNIYVSDTGNDEVKVFNSSGTLLTTLTGLNNPYGIAVDGSGNLYVVNQGTPSVVKYPPVGGYTISGTLPAGLTFNSTTGVISGAPTGAFSSVTYTITCYNAAGSGTTTVTLSCTITTPAFYYSPATNVYSLGVAIPTLTPIVTAGTIGAPGFGAGTTISATFNDPQGVAIDPSGNIYVANTGNGTISKYNSAGILQGTFGTGLTNPMAITFDAAGNAYVLDVGANGGTGRVYEFNSAGVLQRTLNPTGANLGNGFGIAYNASNGNLYVTNGGGYISEFTTAGVAVATITTAPINTPEGIVVDASGNIYEVDNGTGDVYKFSSTGTYISTIVTGLTNPFGLAIDAAGDLFVGNSEDFFFGGTGALYEYSPTGTLITTISGLTDPEGIAIDSKGNAWVSDATNNTFIEYPYGGGYTVSPSLPPGLIFNNTTGTFTGTPTTTFGPTTYTVTGNSYGVLATTTVTLSCTLTAPAITYTPSTDVYCMGTAITALVPVNTGGPVSAMTFAAGTAITGATLNKPYGIGINPVNGDIYVTNEGNGTISYFTSAGTYVGQFSAGFTNPVGIVFDSSGNAYIADKGTGDVYEVTAAGVKSTLIALGGFSFLRGIAIDVSNNLYVANGASGFGFGGNDVYKYSTAGTLLSTLSNTNTTNPTGVAVDASGNIYVLDGTNDNVVEYNSSGTYVSTFASGFNAPNGISVDAAGNVYVGDSGNNEIKVYNSIGTLLATIPNTTLNAPYGLITDSSGNVYVANYGNNTLYEYKVTGNFTISATLPAGLNFNTTTGAITGTPTALSAATVYTIGCSNATGPATTTVNITVSTTPAFTYTTPDVYPANTAITALNPSITTGAGTPASYSVLPALPTGLILNTATGSITGTPTTVTAAANYVVTGTNTCGVGTFTINITVNPALPAISYTTPDVYTVGTAITPLAPTNTGGAVATWSISPALPTGLSFDVTTGIISGTPTVITSAANYIVTATNVTGSAMFTINITVNPPAPVITYTTPDVYGVGTAITPLDPTNTGGAVVTWAISPGLPPGLSFDVTTGDITGTPTADAPATNYTVSATNAGGTGTFVINIMVSLDAPVIAYTTPDTYTVGSVIAPLAPTNTGGAPVSYSVSPGLPSGLTLNVTTGVITGTPTAVTAAANYTVTATNSAGSGTFVINIACVAGGPVLSYTSPDVFPVGTAITPISPVNTGTTPVSYGISPGLPTGLNFDTTTGIISGTPTVTSAATTYTVTATDASSNTGTATIVIACSGYVDWIGVTSNDWNVPANWSTGAVPTATDIAGIGVNQTFLNFPNLGPSGAATNSVAAVVIGSSSTQVTAGTSATAQAGGFVVNTGSTLNVTGNITYQSDANAGTLTATLSGPGTVNAAGIDVTANTTLGAAYTETLSSSAGSLNISSDITLNSSDNSGTAFNSTFNVTGGVVALTGVVTTNNTAAATSTLAVLPATTATLQFANSAGLSGLSATGTNVINFNNTGATVEYSGAGQTYYTDAAITGLGAGVQYNSLKFSGSGLKSPTGSTTNNVFIAGDFTNALTLNDATDFIDFSEPTVIFNGGTQNIYAGNGTGTLFYNSTFSGTGTTTIQSGNLYVAPVGTLTMAGTATLAAGGFLTLNSSNTATAAIAPIPSGCSITGTVNVQRYVSGYRSYRLISSQVSAGTTPNGTASMNYLLNSFYLTGPGAGFTATGNPTLFLYDESFVPQYSTFYNSNFIAVSSMSSGTGNTPTYPVYTNGAGLTGSYAVPAGNGCYVFYRGNLSEGTANLTTPGYSPVLPTIATASGTLNQGQVTFNSWYAPSSSTFGGVSQYWYLVGNPYASAIDLAQVQGTTTSSGIFMTPYNSGTNTGITSFIYELNPATGLYPVYDAANPALSSTHASEFIGSGQGFLIEAYGANSSQLVFNENAKATLTNANMPPGFMSKRINNLAAINPGVPNPILRLKMTLDTTNNEETVITFNPKSSSGFVINEDARHWKGESLIGFTSISSDNVPLAINSLPLAATQTIPLRTVATNDGLYSISLSQQAPLPALYDMWLKDAYMKDSLDIKDNPTYSFNILHSDTNSFGDHRFSLVIRQNPALMVHLLSFNAIKATGGDNVLWTTENEANYTNFAVQRSTDGGATFTTLGALLSSGLGSYSYLDGKPVQGANSYRLQLTDLNGVITYSNVITIMYANTGNQIALNGFMVYPNPTAGAVNLSITQPAASANTSASTNYTIQIVNNLGVVLKTAQSSSPQWQTDVSALVPGTYFITVMNTNTNTLVGRSAFVKL